MIYLLDDEIAFEDLFHGQLFDGIYLYIFLEV